MKWNILKSHFFRFFYTVNLKTWIGVSFEAFPLKPISFGIGLDMKKSPCPNLWPPDCNKRHINFKFMRSLERESKDVIHWKACEHSDHWNLLYVKGNWRAWGHKGASCLGVVIESVMSNQYPWVINIHVSLKSFSSKTWLIAPVYSDCHGFQKQSKTK